MCMLVVVVVLPLFRAGAVGLSWFGCFSWFGWFGWLD